MSDTRLAQLWQSLKDALCAIDGTSPYHYRVRAEDVYTEMVLLLSLPLGPRQPAFLLGPGDGGSRVYRPSMRVQERYVFSIEARVDTEGSDPGRKLEAFTALVADLEHALTRDLSRGGLAVTTLVRTPQGPFMGPGNQQMVLLSQDVELVAVRPYGEG